MKGTMKESRKKLLQLIYEQDQNVGGPLQIASDGRDIGSDSLTLRNDVSYLKQRSYIYEPINAMRSYCLSLTKEGERFVENGFQSPSETLQQSSFNFDGASISNAIIGNNASNNEFITNGGAPLSELQKLIQEKPFEDQMVLQELVEALHQLLDSDEPVQRGLLSKCSDAVKKHTDLITPIGTALVNGLFGIS